MSKKIVIGIGEILWDVFGEEKRLGGAPANFAHHASQTGAEGVAVSAVGDDALGDAIFAELAGKTLRAEFQRVSGVPTGTVAVSLDASGSARYAFPSDSAWDHLAFTERLRDLAARADAVCFGTLMQRSETSRETVRAFLRATPENALRVFDANLRADFYSEKLVRESLALANVLKINEDELRVLGGFFGVPAGDAFAAVTRGPLVLARDEREDVRFAEPVRVLADGAGVVAATRVPRPDGRLAFRVPTEQGEITLFDYASVDCWHGTRICTWLPQPK